MELKQEKLDNKAQLRQRILDQASLLLTEEGPQALSMRKLSKQVGASTIVLYTYFQNKQDIFNELYLEGFARLRQDLETVPVHENPLEYVMDLGRAYRNSAVKNPTYYQIMFSQSVPDFTPPPESLEKSQQSFNVLVKAVQRCRDANILKPGDVLEIAQVLWGTLHGMVSLELFGYFSSKKSGKERLEEAMLILKEGLIHIEGETI
ncbi:MAG: TetR/AcrR family transcriptional regulator [SAR324 cluster bacterium]|nr:TetR/AcrR family transcriptional regulator [SAR324 cluster bacterium]MBF0352979.1 TetR/AcrR family transcriptional regulator [SAR324 cluster bacterium]